MGHIIAHEMSHAFDVEAASANTDGLYYDWYSETTKRRITDHKRCLRTMYGVPDNGSWSTESEDYADTLGLMVSVGESTRFRENLHRGVTEPEIERAELSPTAPTPAQLLVGQCALASFAGLTCSR